ncbi:PAS domain S-box-containing protein [Scopulibacillus darangshiensis]|uniref:PAS domain S-box-containing protein n=1 Tax=Scopulibacillus darangshiensis TaxID=442528 RepID=A0A4R2PBP1_9BACL|nr:sigma-54-dependent Fis family transcriptional regulator [Scopulibacillus darangshiensis]TCP31818.1 PAS domain S-box-containing protein [Scopulibacillus darangshiensis]
MKTVLIIGGGKQSLDVLRTFLKAEKFVIKAIVDTDQTAPGIDFAKENHLTYGPDWQAFLDKEVDIIIVVQNDTKIFEDIRMKKPAHTIMIPYGVVNLISELNIEIEGLIERLKDQTYQQKLILDLTHDAMIAINCREEITVFNPSAEKMSGLNSNDVLGKKVGNVMPSTKLPRVLKLRQPEINQEQQLENGNKIITTRLPMLDPNGNPHGAFAVFKDITDIENLAEEVTNLKSIQTMLSAIIQSSEEAISVVDENGRGLMINPAYTKLTGLTESDVIGKPATADISEGDSMHMQVLKTRKPVRGVRMKVGQAKRDVIVNVAPVIVNGKLKGSVGVIQDMSEITSLTNELDRARQIIRTLEAKYSFEDIIGKSEEAKLVIEQAKLAASTPITILLRGESGTGKELFAHAIHNASDRKYNKFIRVNCAAISESLLESEMFGYEEGAFSGAKRGGKRGYFEEAEGGSIFLDEIGELSIHMQAKLLRVLQEKEILRVGGTNPISVNVRVITATNVNLEKGIAEESFREDLYYRLNRMPIFIPPLRQRKEDIADLCMHLINKINQDYGRNIEEITPEAIELLMKYDWPGNVRELENVLGRAIIHMDIHEFRMQAKHIPNLNNKQTGKTKPNPAQSRVTMDGSLSDIMDRYEKDIIQRALADHDMNKTKTARALGVSVRNLYYKMEKHELEKSFLQ